MSPQKIQMQLRFFRFRLAHLWIPTIWPTLKIASQQKHKKILPYRGTPLSFTLEKNGFPYLLISNKNLKWQYLSPSVEQVVVRI